MGMEFDTSKFIKALDAHNKKVNDLQNIDISYDELFTKEFMIEHANVDSITEFFKAGSIEFMTADQGEIDKYVNQITKFDNFEQMKAEALRSYIARKLK